MAYPRLRGDDPLNFEEYDPTPFSGGYDQTALYGLPKPSSAQTCYPASDSIHQSSHAGSGYGDASSPHMPVDESRPVYKQHDPPHGSGDEFPSGYGKQKPSFGYGQNEGGSGYSGVDSGYGRPKPKPARHESEQNYGENYEFGQQDQPGYGRPKPRPSNDSFFEGNEEEYGAPKPSFGRPKPGAYSQEVEEGYGYSKPSYGSAFEDSYQKPPPPPEEESFGGGYGGRKPTRYEGEESGYGDDGGRKPSRYGDRPGYGGEQAPDEAGYGGYRKNTWEEEGGEHHHDHGHKEHHKHHWRNDEDE